MREILFRGIPKEKSDGYTFSKIWSDNCDGSFVYGSLLISKGKYYICASSIFKINCCINNAMMSVIEVIPESVGQYTGLESNGKKVFGGDICKSGNETYKIVWNEHRHGWYREFIKPKCVLCKGFLFPLWHWNESFEIIGNTLDNPELLEGGESE